MQPQLVWTAITTGEVIPLAQDDEDLLIAIIVSLLHDAMILDAELIGD